MKSLKTNLYFKIGAIIVIILLLLIPTAMIKGLIIERQDTQDLAIKEVTDKYAGEQTLIGPFISIPYTVKNYRYSKSDSSKTVIETTEYLHILPNELKLNGKLIPEKKYRGIYEVVVYNSIISFSGNFSPIDLSGLSVQASQLQLDKAEFVIGLSDLRGIEKIVTLNWKNKAFLFNPGVSSNDIVSTGINALISLKDSTQQLQDFKFDLNLNGSQKLYFTPVGKTTDINFTSNWSNPSFNGTFLPDKKQINDKGFSVNWNVLHLNRNFPQRWTNAHYQLNNDAFGIDLILPVDNYQKAYRSIEYAILFIGFTFLVFFFIEIMNKVFIHPIQYILVGIALVVFYTLLISISEHVPFNLAFILSAIATLLLIAGYVKAILKSTQLTLLISSILLILYSFIFVIIQLQDYALLIGSIGIFLILGLVMYFSRKIDWYAITLKE